MPTTLHQTVRDLALSVPGATRAFERAGIDYCCGGGRTLEDACAGAGVDASEMLSTLRGLEEAGAAAAGDRDFTAMALEALVDHIVRTHHAFTVSELARLDQLLTKVRAKHEPGHPE